MRAARLRPSSLAAILACVALARPAAADCPALQQAERAYADLDYDRVTPLLEQALEARCDDAARARTLALLAEMHVTYNRDDEAVAAFVQLLALEPGFNLPPDRSPKLLQALQRAQDQAAPAPALEVAPAVAPAASTSPETAVVDAAADSPAALDAVTSDDGWWLWAGLGAALGTVALAAAGAVTWILLQPASPDVDFGPYPL